MHSTVVDVVTILAILLGPTGCGGLFRDWMEMPNAARQPLAIIRAQPASLFIAGLTSAAAGILVIVV